jgi:hypothetical protein
MHGTGAELQPIAHAAADRCQGRVTTQLPVLTWRRTRPKSRRFESLLAFSISALFQQAARTHYSALTRPPWRLSEIARPAARITAPLLLVLGSVVVGFSPSVSTGQRALACGVLH